MPVQTTMVENALANRHRVTVEVKSALERLDNEVKAFHSEAEPLALIKDMAARGFNKVSSGHTSTVFTLTESAK